MNIQSPCIKPFEYMTSLHVSMATLKSLSDEKNVHVRFKLGESVFYSNLGEAQHKYQIDWIDVC